MLARIERGVEVQRRFTADASHELRSPLSRLRVELEIAARRPRSAQEYHAVIESCFDEVKRMTRLVEELLALARFDAELVRPAPVSTNLRDVVGEVVSRCLPQAAEAGVRLDMTGVADLAARIDPAPAASIATNLIENAIKFSPEPSTVAIRLRRIGDEAELSVCDEGAGFSAEDAPHLFERFYRGRSARAAASTGQGLGLALCKSIVQVYRGSIDARNRAEGGAEFVVRLPLGDEELSVVALLQAAPHA
jgi:two-component system OmpR family sensor kinase